MEFPNLRSQSHSELFLDCDQNQSTTTIININQNRSEPISNRTCEECFTTILTPQQIDAFLNASGVADNIADLCANLTGFSEDAVRELLTESGVSASTQNELITCLEEAGIEFSIGD
jgi:hypothetical protein